MGRLSIAVDGSASAPALREHLGPLLLKVIPQRILCGDGMDLGKMLLDILHMEMVRGEDGFYGLR